MKVSANSFFVKKLKYNCLSKSCNSSEMYFVRYHMQSTAGVDMQVSVVFLLNSGDIMKHDAKTFFKGLCALWQHYLGPMNALCRMLNAGSSCHENMFHLANLIKA